MPKARRLLSFVVLLLITAISSAVPPNDPPDERKETPRSATRPARTAVAAADPETAPLLDAALTAWLSQSRNAREPKEPKVAILLAGHWPAGYSPRVQGWTVLPVEEDDPRSPPESAIAGATEYRFHIQSSYRRIQRAKDESKRDAARTRPATRPTRTIEITNPPVLRVTRVQIKGDAAEVELEQNRHHNLGGSGGTFTANKTAGRWRCTLHEVWKS